MDEKPSLPRRSKSAATFLTYVRERMDTFLDRPLCAIDSLVFSWLAYAHLGEDQVNACLPEGIALHEMLRAEEFDNMFGSTWDPEGSRDLLFAVCASPRFRDARLTEFRFKTARSAEEQFAAMTFILPDGSSYVAFRGTDSTIVGWKEDFNMTFLNPVPAQEERAPTLNTWRPSRPARCMWEATPREATSRSTRWLPAISRAASAWSGCSRMTARDSIASSAHRTPTATSSPSW